MLEGDVTVLGVRGLGRGIEVRLAGEAAFPVCMRSPDVGESGPMRSMSPCEE